MATLYGRGIEIHLSPISVGDASLTLPPYLASYHTQVPFKKIFCNPFSGQRGFFFKKKMGLFSFAFPPFPVLLGLLKPFCKKE